MPFDDLTAPALYMPGDNNNTKGPTTTMTGLSCDAPALFMPNDGECDDCEKFLKELDKKQDKLTAGENIQISDQNVISATDTKYSAGDNVQISDQNVISATDTKYSAGTGVQISASNVISADRNPGNTYTKAEVDAIIAALQTLRMVEVPSLPATGEDNVIYLVPKTGGGYEMYVWATDHFVDVGKDMIDMSDYVRKVDSVASITRSGTTFTAKNSAGTTLFTFDQQDNNTTYSAGMGLRLDGTTFSTTVPRVNKNANYLPGINRWVLEEYQNGTNVNLPSNAWYHIYTSEGDNANYACQLALGMTTEAAYYRAYMGGSWKAWRRIDIDTVTRVKGNAESAYRTGDVNLTAANLGFQWSGQTGQPKWLWGGATDNDNNNFKVWSPSNFSVNYANSANTANSATRATTAGTADTILFPSTTAWATKNAQNQMTSFQVPRSAKAIFAEVEDANGAWMTFSFPSNIDEILDRNNWRDLVSGYYLSNVYNASVGIRVSRFDGQNYNIQCRPGWCSCCVNSTSPRTGVAALSGNGRVSYIR